MGHLMKKKYQVTGHYSGVFRTALLVSVIVEQEVTAGVVLNIHPMK